MIFQTNLLGRRTIAFRGQNYGTKGEIIYVELNKDRNIQIKLLLASGYISEYIDLKDLQISGDKDA